MKLKEKWVLFLRVILGPGSVIFIVLTVIGLVLAFIFKTNTLFATLLSVLSSVFAGISGSFIKDDYERMVGQNILEKKGRSALRNLQGINTQLCNIKIWIVDFIKKIKKQEYKSILEEINRHISTIELNIVSGLKDWEDIVPELKEKNEKDAEIDKKYKETAQSVMIELLEKRKELASVKDEKIEQELLKKIDNLEKQIKEIKKDRSQSNHGLVWGSGVSSGPLNSISVANIDDTLISSLNTQKCLKCGKKFERNYLSASALYNDNYCDECRKDLYGGILSI